ncbi:MAG TPA: type II toxin-antitoxin system VapC family toxin [Flexivirga sp.]|uniref:type II toxin-antitoxin system VapC family toxin n=1 Tax=Flexivirga sp. TaxID=1962927 RepID=UPI002BED5D0D|nr:type II toxin-antitoxin system VapC family toxin [Flexivirga sp.]HWC22272.1 type II toxin-antitoxin system VapC family toxin [Flexivirga sp.]
MTARKSGRGRVVLLDTNAFLSLNVEPDRINAEVRERLAQLSTGLIVSAASAWEVAIKVRQGKLPGGDRLVESWSQSLRDLQAEALSIDAEDAIRAGGLRWAHRDPFDRMLVAQALRYNYPLVTSDATIIGARIATTIDTR